MNWQPIETAPKDGRCILVFVPGDYFPMVGVAGNTGDVYVMRWNSHGEGGWDQWDSYHDLDADAPTHWMPLPEPPGPGQEGE